MATRSNFCLFWTWKRSWIKEETQSDVEKFMSYNKIDFLDFFFFATLLIFFRREVSCGVSRSWIVSSKVLIEQRHKKIVDHLTLSKFSLCISVFYVRLSFFWSFRHEKSRLGQKYFLFQVSLTLWNDCWCCSFACLINWKIVTEQASHWIHHRGTIWIVIPVVETWHKRNNVFLS